MSAIDLDVRRSPLDYLLLGFVALALLTLVSLGLYGSFTGFLQTTAYYHANNAVSLATAVISAGCALYLLLELTPARLGRLAFGVCALSAMFGFFAVSKGVPAAVTMAYGKPGQVVFEIRRFDWGSKHCASTVVASHPAYEDFRQCIDNFPGLEPKVGRRVEVYGTISAWGIAREGYSVIR